VVNDQDGQLELALELAQVGEQGGDLRGIVFIYSMEPDEGVQGKRR
jgi:hypothetical protein